MRQLLPQRFEVKRPFGPLMAVIQLPEEILFALIRMTDHILNDPLANSHGPQLAGAIKTEKTIYRSQMIKAGVDDFLEECVRNYITTSAKEYGLNMDSLRLESYISEAWIVSQYENEYNPLHRHFNSEISGVIYLNVPKTLDRAKDFNKSMDNDGRITFAYNTAPQRDVCILDRGTLSVTPSDGGMLIFPSYLLHAVYPFYGEGERRSIAFNARYQITSSSSGTLTYIAGNKTNFNLGTNYFD